MATKKQKAAGRRLSRISKCAWKKAKKSGKYRTVGKGKSRRKMPTKKHFASCK